MPDDGSLEQMMCSASSCDLVREGNPAPNGTYFLFAVLFRAFGALAPGMIPLLNRSVHYLR